MAMECTIFNSPVPCHFLSQGRQAGQISQYITANFSRYCQPAAHPPLSALAVLPQEVAPIAFSYRLPNSRPTVPTFGSSNTSRQWSAGSEFPSSGVTNVHERSAGPGQGRFLIGGLMRRRSNV